MGGESVQWSVGWLWISVDDDVVAPNRGRSPVGSMGVGSGMGCGWSVTRKNSA